MFVLYLYVTTGGITGFLIHKRLESNEKDFPEKKEKFEQKSKEENIISEERKEVIYEIDPESIIEKIKDIKKNVEIVKCLLDTRKKIEDLKKENIYILQDIAEKISKK